MALILPYIYAAKQPMNPVTEETLITRNYCELQNNPSHQHNHQTCLANKLRCDVVWAFQRK